MKLSGCGVIVQHPEIYSLASIYPLFFILVQLAFPPEIKSVPHAVLTGFRTGDVSLRESSCWLAVFVHTFFLLDVLGDYVWCLKEEADGGGSQRQQELSNKSERKGPCGQQGMKR